MSPILAVDLFPRTRQKSDINLGLSNHVETVCLLSKLHEAKHHVSVKLDMDEMDLTSAESKAKIEVTETALVEAKTKKRSILAQKVCGDNIYKSLVFFDKMNDIMNDAERRQFICRLIEKVEIFEEEQANGQWLKSITFKLPIIPHDMEISLDNGSQIETVVLMSRADAAGRYPDGERCQ